MDPSDLENFTEEELQQLIDLGIIPEQMAGLDRQYKVAEKLRSTPIPEGRNSGRVYTAANPMEGIGALMQQYAGLKKEKSIEERQAELLRKQSDARGNLFNKFAGIVPGVTGGVKEGNYDVPTPSPQVDLGASPQLPQGAAPVPMPARPRTAGPPTKPLTKEELLKAAMALRLGASGGW